MDQKINTTKRSEVVKELTTENKYEISATEQGILIIDNAIGVDSFYINSINNMKIKLNVINLLINCLGQHIRVGPKSLFYK